MYRDWETVFLSSVTGYGYALFTSSLMTDLCLH